MALMNCTFRRSCILYWSVALISMLACMRGRPECLDGGAPRPRSTGALAATVNDSCRELSQSSRGTLHRTSIRASCTTPASMHLMGTRQSTAKTPYSVSYTAVHSAFGVASGSESPLRGLNYSQFLPKQWTAAQKILAQHRGMTGRNIFVTHNAAEAWSCACAEVLRPRRY